MAQEHQRAKGIGRKNQPKETSRMQGGKKSSRWSAQTKANKARKALTRAQRFKAAAVRRERGATVTVPLNAMTDTGKKNEAGEPILVPHKQRGKTVKSATALDARVAQSRRISQKRNQRREFAKLSPAEKDRRRIFRKAHGSEKASG